MKHRLTRKVISVLIAVLMAVTTLTPTLTAFADDGVIGYYDIELFFDDGTIIPDKNEDETDYYIYLEEGKTIQLDYELIDCSMPDNGYIKWYSETPGLVSVDENGLVRGHDSSKGAVVQEWIDNDVKTIPLVGKIMGAAIEKLVFNDTVDLDTMDTDAIMQLVGGYFDTSPILNKYAAEYKDQLLASLQARLDSVNSNIHVSLYKADGTLLDDDQIHVVVQKSTELYADLIPNGTHITNKDSLPSTVAVDTEQQIYAVTTPVRLHMGVIYSVKSSSIFSTGKVVATIDDGGLVTFKNTGTVTIVVSPDTEGFIENLMKYINYVYALDNTGTVDSTKVADILISVCGLDINRNVLAAILDTCYGIYDIVGDTADPVQLTATAAEIIANFVYQFTTNDTYTFTVVESQPCTDFSISGTTSVQEGNDVQLDITDAKPEAANLKDITWKSSDSSIASVDEKTGVITGRDAGGSLGALSSQTVEITATSAANNVSKTVTLTVTGKTGKYLSDAEIVADTDIDIGTEQDLSYTIYPNRVATADNLYVTWGIVTAGTDEESYEYEWATEPYTEVVNEGAEDEYTVEHDGTVTDGIGTVTNTGHYIATDGGTCKVALKAVTGYYVNSTYFYEISSTIATLDISNGVPIDEITINATDVTSGGTLTVTNTDYGTYATIKKTVMDAYLGNGAKVGASISPANASNKTLKWYIEGSNNFKVEVASDFQSASVTMKAAVETADSVTVYATSEDGRVKSNPITVCVTRNYATGNVINADNYDLLNGETSTATHTMSFSGSWTGGAYACYDCNWFSSDEDVFSVTNAGNDNSDGKLIANGVGRATLTCVSADGGIVDTATVVVRPDKTYLKEVVSVCENTVVKRTTANKTLYKEYMKNLDYCYYILNEEMATQNVCDSYAKELLMSFYRLGGFVGLNSITLKDKSSKDLATEYLSVPVSTTNYTSTSYDLNYSINPENAMYKSVSWTSSDSAVSVDKNGLCKPSSNNPCSATITVSAVDYMGTVVSDSVTIAFAKTQATGISLDATSIVAGKVGESQTITPTVTPTGTLGVGARSVSKVIWTSDNDEIASVDANGLVSFLRGGDCVITATTADGGFTATCSVNVVTNYDALQGLLNTYNSISLDETSYFPETWDEFTNAKADSQTMISRNVSTQDEVDEMYARLESSYKGLKKYNKIQKVELYLDGEQASEFYQYDLSLLAEGISYKNAQLNLNVRLYPSEECNYQSVEWSSSTDKIAVTSEGVCSPTVNESCYGQITVTVTDHFGDTWQDTVYVSFAYYIVTAVDMSESSIAGPIGTSYQLSATIQPTGTSLLGVGKASIQDYYWWSEDESIASVDEKGLVTFNETGATHIYATSYDGGVTGSCLASTNGDRSALELAIETYKDIDPMDYEYSYGSQFKTAYDYAVEVMGDVTKSQMAIDIAATSLNERGAALADHPYVKVTDLTFNYTDWNYGTFSGWTSKASGTIDNNYHTLAAYSSTMRSNTRISVSTSVYPANAMYKSMEITELEGSSRSTETLGDGSFALKPSSTLADCYDVIKYTVTDDWGRVYTETVTLCIPKTAVNGISLNQSSLTTTVPSGQTTLAATISPSNATYSNVTWKSSNENAATVDSNGVVTPIETGSAVITARTLDGGFTATCNVTVQTNFNTLASTYGEYLLFFNEVDNAHTHQYTVSSMEVLNQALLDAKIMIDENKAKQSVVNSMVETLVNAKNSLVEFNGMKGVDIYKSQTTETATHYQYYNALSINGATVQLNAVALPNDYTEFSTVWSSSNEAITVDENGLVKNTTASPAYAKITCSATDEFGDVYTDSVYVSFVRIKVSSVTFSQTSITGNVGEVATVTASTNTTASIKDLLYTSADESVATVDSATGEITFVGAGATTITATAYDNGVSAELTVVSKGDTSALEQAIALANDVDYSIYEYSYGTAFLEAKNNAETTLNSIYSTQTEIDLACTNLTTAMNNLEGHIRVSLESVSMQYNSVDVEDNARITTTANSSITLTALITPLDASVTSTSFTLTDEKNITAVQNGNDFTLTLNGNGGYGTVNLAVTDDYGIETSITKTIYLGEYFAQGISFENTEVIKDFADESFTLTPIFNPTNASITDVIWSSSDESVVTVDNGVVTIVESGNAVVSATTIDGGYTASVNVTIRCDFSALNNLYTSCQNAGILAQNYTDSTFSAYDSAMTNAKAVLDNADSTQTSINSAVTQLQTAFDSLVPFTAISDINIVNSNNESTEREEVQSNLSLNGKTVQLGVNINPSTAPSTVKWTSSNANVSVDENGLVTNKSATAKYSVITVTVTDGHSKDYTDSVYVSFVRNSASTVSFGAEMVYGSVGTTKQIAPIVLSASTTADVTDCTYYSSDESVATVSKGPSSSATVTFKDATKSATIYAVSVNGGNVGSITAYCTNDTTALYSAINEYSTVEYTDYAYDYGTAFKDAYENAQSVYADPYASQETIDSACNNLISAYNSCVENPFVLVGTLDIIYNSKSVISGGTIAFGTSSNATFEATYVTNFEAQDVSWTVSGNGVSYTENGNTLNITKESVPCDITIKVVVTDKYLRTTEKEVTVKFVDYAVTGVSLNQISKNIDLSTTSTYQLSPTVSPSNATVKDVNYESSNEDVATVDGNGLVTFHATGSATITVRTVDGGFASICGFNVSNSDFTVSITENDVAVTSTSVTLKRLLPVNLTFGYLVTPSDAEITNVAWSSDNTNVTVAEDGTATFAAYPTGTGYTAVITVIVTDAGGNTATNSVTVSCAR